MQEKKLTGFNQETGKLKGFDNFIVCLRDPIHRMCVHSIFQCDLFSGNHLIFTNMETFTQKFYVVCASSLN